MVRMEGHRAHHYGALIKRWRAVARGCGWRMGRIAKASGEDIFCLRSRGLKEKGGIYLSAGVHGDEPGGTEGLIGWAERNLQQLAKLPVFLLPCLNPWGLVNNQRETEDGVDLNRSFHREDLLVIRAVKELVEGHEFAAALMLHEDFDGQGFYLYETEGVRPFWGESLIAVAVKEMAIDPRGKIDGRKASGGLIRRRVSPKRFAKIGLPEAIWLHAKHAERSLTIETPSEFALERRIAAQMAVIEECVRRVVAV